MVMMLVVSMYALSVNVLNVATFGIQEILILR